MSERTFIDVLGRCIRFPAGNVYVTALINLISVCPVYLYSLFIHLCL
jgi:hypothetical protein